MGNEMDLQKTIAMEMCGKRTRLWVNDTGMAYQGKVTRMGNSAVINNVQGISYGLCKGSSDLIGFHMIKITEDMVGQELPVFTAIEVKTKTGRATQEQKAFLTMVRDNNGYAGIARSTEDARKILGSKPC